MGNVARTDQIDEGALGLRLGNAMHAAVHGLPMACVGQTWGDMKVAIERGLGVKDSDFIASFEYGTAQMGIGQIVREDVDGQIEIREVR